MRIGRIGVQRNACGEGHRQGASTALDESAQIARFGAHAQQRQVAQTVQRLGPCKAQIDRQGVGRTLGTLQAAVMRHPADSPAIGDAARITQVDSHIVIALLAQKLAPTYLQIVKIVEPPIACHRIVVGPARPAVGRRNLPGMNREGGHRGVVVDGVRPRNGGHRHTSHAQHLGVGSGKHRVLCPDRRKSQRKQRNQQEMFHAHKDKALNPQFIILPRKRFVSRYFSNKNKKGARIGFSSRKMHPPE